MNLKLSVLIVVAFLFLGLMPNKLMGQFTVIGTINDEDGTPLVGANIQVQPSNIAGIADELGEYQISISSAGKYTLVASYLGYESKSIELEIISEKKEYIFDFLLGIDPLQLSPIVIIDRGNKKSALQLSQKINSIPGQQLRSYSAYGVSDLLGNVNGVYTDASAGEVFTRVYTRGISISAEDDLGWYYVGLEEDGLPISATQHIFYSPDLFHRLDISTEKLEGINGGKSAIIGNNSPGALFNFISKTGGQDKQGQVLLSTGLEGSGNYAARVDAAFSGPLAGGWSYYAGGFYRKGEGARDIDLNWNRGGQVKMNLTKKNNNSRFKMYAKYLNDHTNRWSGLPAKNWDKPEPAFGVDFSSSAQLLPSLNTRIADGRPGNSDFEFNTDNGIHTKDLAVGMEYVKYWDQWTLSNNFKFSNKSANWETAIGNQPLDLASFFPYLLSGISPDFSVIPLGNVVFRDARTNEMVASVNNFGILGPFEGKPATYEYTQGSLPNNALMGIAPWKKTDEATEFMNRLSLSGKAGNHQLSSSIFFARSSINTFTSGSFAYATYEAVPRMLRVSLENPGEETIELSDNSGVSNYGGLFFNQAEADVTQMNAYINDQWDISEDITLDAGIQLSTVNHDGSKARSEPTGDIDNNATTAYNNSVLNETSRDIFDHTYNNLSWSAGVLKKLGKNASIYGRYTSGKKSPELNYAFNNFQNVAIPGAGKSQSIQQIEGGWNKRAQSFSLSVSMFYSRLSNVSFSEFVLDEETGNLFYTPELLNKTSTLGLNAEAFLTISRFLSIKGKMVLQNPKATDYRIYDTSGTFDTGDDTTIDFSGNDLPHNPKVTFSLTPELKLAKNRVYARYSFIGSRAGNVENAFYLPAFGKVDLGVDFAYTDDIIFSLVINNLLNSAGLMNFYGPNDFGSSANAATADYIRDNPNGSFVVFPIMPRAMYFKMSYGF